MKFIDHKALFLESKTKSTVNPEVGVGEKEQRAQCSKGEHRETGYCQVLVLVTLY